MSAGKLRHILASDLHPSSQSIRPCAIWPSSVVERSSGGGEKAVRDREAADSYQQTAIGRQQTAVSRQEKQVATNCR